TYSNKFKGVHDLSAMVGQEAQRSDYEGSSIQKFNFASNDIQVLSQGDNTTSRSGGYKGASSLMSYFTRVNYGYSDRYLLTVTMRADASTKFGPNNKWGYFPSAPVASRVSEEAFMQDQEFITNMKFRLGYGQVGNQAIGDYLYGST